MGNEILDVLKQFMQQANTIALTEQQQAAAHLKADDTYVTSVDLRVSELSLEVLSSVIPEGHIITEERLDNLHTLIERDTLRDAELLAFVDPIDGTRNYFHNMPLYGISAGILRNRKPWIGMVGFPSLGETYYCDGEAAYLSSGSSGSEPSVRKLDRLDMPLNRNSVVLLSNSFARQYEWNYDVCTMMLTACVTLNCCWPSIGRGIGTVLTDHIWDFAGGWPILAALGFQLRGAFSGREITHFDPVDYRADSLLLTEPAVLSRPEHYEGLRAAIRKRNT